MRLHVTHHFDADVATVFAVMSDPDAVVAKYAAIGATDVRVVSHNARDGAPLLVTSRKVTIDLPGFAKRVMSPTNTVVQTDDWQPPAADGTRACHYRVEVQGVPSRIEGTVTLVADGAQRTRQDVEAEVRVSVPLVGGRLEKLAVDSGVRTLQDEADFTASRLARG